MLSASLSTAFPHFFITGLGYVFVLSLIFSTFYPILQLQQINN